jgi:hypothetical protein
LDRKNSGVNTTPRAQGKAFKLCPKGMYGSQERDACINFIEGSFDWKFKVLVHFLRVKRVKGN